MKEFSGAGIMRMNIVKTFLRIFEFILMKPGCEGFFIDNLTVMV